MPDKDTIPDAELFSQVDDVLGIAIQIGVFFRLIGGQIRAARADLIEQNGLEPRLERGGHQPPHVLVAAEAVGEHHGAGVRTAGDDIMALRDRHGFLPQLISVGLRQRAVPDNPARRAPGRAVLRGRFQKQAAWAYFNPSVQ